MFSVEIEFLIEKAFSIVLNPINILNTSFKELKIE
jgi:hypothetical protein